MIFRKHTLIGRARRSANAFEDQFWSGKDLVTMYNQLGSLKHELRGLERIFQAGFREFARLRGQEGMDSRAILEGTERAMRVALSHEVEELEINLTFLATVGSTSPYIGLFGTVWGIMNS
jgi:biopolymer transport protein TolQ